MSTIREILGDYAPTDKLKEMIQEVRASLNTNQTVMDINRIISDLNEEARLTIIKQDAVKNLDPKLLASEEAFQRTWLKANTILRKNAVQAAMSTDEYNDEFFISRLEEATSDEACISYNVTGDSINVIIDLNVTAGSLEDYIDAVEAWRSEHYGDKARPSPDLASRMWAEKIYGVDREGKSVLRWNKKHTKSHDVTANFEGKYWQTMEERLEMSGKIAPFWQLLNDGNTGGGEGTPYPAQEPTYFVEKSEAETSLFYNNTYISLITKLETQINKFLVTFQKQLDKISIVIDKCEAVRVQILRDEEIQSKTDQKKKAQIVESKGDRNFILSQRLTLQQKLEEEAIEAQAELARIKALQNNNTEAVENIPDYDSIVNARKATIIEILMSHLTDVERSKVDNQRIAEIAEEISQGDISSVKSRIRISLGGGVRKSFGNILEEL